LLDGLIEHLIGVIQILFVYLALRLRHCGRSQQHHGHGQHDLLNHGTLSLPLYVQQPNIREPASFRQSVENARKTNPAEIVETTKQESLGNRKAGCRAMLDPMCMATTCCNLWGEYDYC
jgi:hypothetical protein